MEEIIRLEEELRLAMLENNVDVLDRLIDDSLVFVAPNGALVTKQMDLDGHKNKIQKINKLEPSEQVIHEKDGVIIVSVKMDIKGEYCGADISGVYRYLRVWAKEQGASDYKIVSGSVVPVLG